MTRLLPVMIGVAFSWACATPTVREAPERPAPLHELWQEPTDLAQRDLFHGTGGRELVPNPHARYSFIAEDTTGASGGYTVRDEQQREWDVKLGIEVQPEVAVSRLLWAIGFHQPPVYLVPGGWTLSAAPGWLKGANGPQRQARFRPDLTTDDVIDEWSWYDNPFVGTRAYKGLLVANLILANWDFKTTNNKVYRLNPPRSGTSHMYVVRDLGAALGSHSPKLPWLRLRAMQGSKNDLQSFERTGFITAVREDRVELDYRGIDRALFDEITAADVRWVCRLFDRLDDGQWHDAFRAAGYDRDTADRYIRKIKQKVAQGAALR